jgi:hypothetical protein
VTEPASRARPLVLRPPDFNVLAPLAMPSDGASGSGPVHLRD